jgi:hypothetical protein
LRFQIVHLSLVIATVASSAFAQPKCQMAPCICGSIVDSYAAQVAPTTGMAVPAYYNGGSTGISNKPPCLVPPKKLPGQDVAPQPDKLAGQDGEQYECVEFIRRFYRIAKSTPTSAWLADAFEFFADAPSFGLISFNNRGAVPQTVPPQPDDIIAFAGIPSNPSGHVAIVKYIDTSACVSEMAQFKVELIEQNTNTLNSMTGNRHELVGECDLQPNGNYSYHLDARCPTTCSPIQGWLRLPPTGPPPLTWTHNAVAGTGPVLNSNPPVYDPASNQLIVFGGGVCTSGFCLGLNATWVVTNANGTGGGIPQWQQLAPAGALPPARLGQSTIYDTANNRIIIFGGATGDCGVFCTVFNDVWVLSYANGIGGTPTWTQLNPLVPDGYPAPRANHRAVYNPNTNRMITFGGGNNGFNDTNDAWVLTNANGLGGTSQWIPLNPSGTLPPPRELHMQTYDPTTNVMTIFGGNHCCSYYGDLWLLTNANGLGGVPVWQQVTQTSPAPGTLANFNQGYDPATNSMLFFGGSPNFGVFRNDVWVLENANGVGVPTWVNTIPNGVADSPPAGAFDGTYDPVTHRLMIIPDTADLWVFQY